MEHLKEMDLQDNKLSTITSDLLPTTEYYLQAATSSNTRKAYQQDIRHFIRWGALLPTSSEIVIQYLRLHAVSLSPKTLKRRLVAIKHWHIYQGFRDPTAAPTVKKLLSGITRIHGQPPVKAPALSVEQLKKISSYLTKRGGLSDWRDNALLLIGLFGAFRRSELTSIYWQHVNFVREGLTILIPRSKNDQCGEGQICAIPYGNEHFCPVEALSLWQQHSDLSSGAIFRAISKNEGISPRPLSAASVNGIIKKHAIACQLSNAQHYSGHSLRRGFATSASQKGATLGHIMRQGRWRHEGTVQGYIEEGQLFDDNAARTILNNSNFT